MSETGDLPYEWEYCISGLPPLRGKFRTSSESKEVAMGQLRDIKCREGYHRAEVTTLHRFNASSAEDPLNGYTTITERRCTPEENAILATEWRKMMAEENKRLQLEIKELKAKITKEKRKLVALEAENARLREALTDLLLTEDEYACYDMIVDKWDAAQEALANPTPTTGILELAAAGSVYCNVYKQYQDENSSGRIYHLKAVFASMLLDAGQDLIAAAASLSPEVKAMLEGLSGD